VRSGKLWWEGFLEKVSLESGVELRVMHIVKVVMIDDDDDNELVRERCNDSDVGLQRHRQQVGEAKFFRKLQRRGEAWRKERLLTFKKYKGGRARVTTSEERVCDVVEVR